MTVEHIALAVVALGYGMLDRGFLRKWSKKILKIPGNMKVVCLLPIGVPDENPSARPRKRFSEIFSKEQYGAPLEL
jgi:nitroreductase